jgi:hypothetical protein
VKNTITGILADAQHTRNRQMFTGVTTGNPFAVIVFNVHGIQPGLEEKTAVVAAVLGLHKRQQVEDETSRQRVLKEAALLKEAAKLVKSRWVVRCGECKKGQSRVDCPACNGSGYGPLRSNGTYLSLIALKSRA